MAEAATLSDCRQRAGDWLGNTALPFWCAHGFDATTGLAYESLDFTGKPGGQVLLRARVQPRMLYVLCRARQAGCLVPDALIGNCFAALQNYLASPAGGYVAQLTANGRIDDSTRLLYDQAFVLLALAALHEALDSDLQKIIDSEQPLALAHALVDFLTHDMTHPAGGFRESHEQTALPPALPRGQNAHMHLFEAFLALYRATGEVVFKHHAEKIAELFLRHFYDAESGKLFELFHDNWMPFSQAEGQYYVPGHFFEWVFLLHEFKKISAVRHAGIEKAQAALLATALHMGCDSSAVYALDMMDASEEKPATRRLWGQAEMLRTLYLYRHEAEKKAAFLRLFEAVFATYLRTEKAGLWYDKYDDKGAMLARDVPASTFYHLWNALALIAGFDSID